jgi:sterol desaturase/sphingolipid hydroxylase (fatty acid hydroxylase superfamily)
LTLAVIGTADLVGTIVKNEGGVWLALVTGGVLLVAAILLLLGIFLVAPLGLCVGGAALVARLARRRGTKITGSQVLKFGVALVVVNVALALVGAWLWPWWWYTEKMATRAPLWLLVVLFGANAVIDAGAAGVTARSRINRR